MYERIVMPSVLYRGETWGLKEREKNRLNRMEMKFLRSVSGVTRIYMVCDEEIRRRVGVKNKLLG